MPVISQEQRRHLELAFESSYDIVKLAGLEGSDELSGLRERVIAGELDFDDAVQIVLAKIQPDFTHRNVGTTDPSQ